jgi:hypothetical protein
MKPNVIIGAVGVAAFVALATALPAIAEDGSRTSVEEMLPILASQQSASDRVPESVGISALGDISEESVRSLGGDGVANYWVARAGTSEVCLILEIPEEKISASSCGSIADFYHHGISLAAGPSVDDPSSSTEAYLLPADIESSDIGVSKLHTEKQAMGLGAGLVTSRPQESPVRLSEVIRDDGSVFEFAPVTLGKD